MHAVAFKFHSSSEQSHSSASLSTRPAARHCQHLEPVVAACMLPCAAQVIDATWEPVEVAVPPHRRSVPLTFEQIQAQLPPTLDEPPGFSNRRIYNCSVEFDTYCRQFEPQQDGCMLKCLETYGPALTRLTANHAVNVLKVSKSIMLAGIALKYIWCAVLLAIVPSTQKKLLTGVHLSHQQA
jgi:hypothetical protein